MDIEESEGEDDGPCALVDGLLLPLKPGSASGFVGVQRSASKKRPWQATLKVPGRKRLNVGSFKQAKEAAVARARAKAAGGVLLDSPRKQAARKSGARPKPRMPDPDPNRNPFLTATSFRALAQSSSRRPPSSSPSRSRSQIKAADYLCLRTGRCSAMETRSLRSLSTCRRIQRLSACRMPGPCHQDHCLRAWQLAAWRCLLRSFS